MTRTVFPYPGGKSRYADFVVKRVPEHTAYVEVFGGAAGVLFNKPRSKVEVYNDIDDDLVQFFEVLRDRGDDLIEWLRAVPYARTVFEQWKTDFYTGHRPDDPIERAGRFFALRYMQYSGVYRCRSAMSSSTAAGSGTNAAQRFANKRDRLGEFARRLDGVQIESMDYTDVVEKYDHPSTVFYFDPPYYGTARYRYRVGDGFDHDAFVDVLDDIDGRWLVSYNQLPPALSDAPTDERTVRYSIGSGGDGDGAGSYTERLVSNFDTDAINPAFNDGDLSAWGDHS